MLVILQEQLTKLKRVVVSQLSLLNRVHLHILCSLALLSLAVQRGNAVFVSRTAQPCGCLDVVLFLLPLGHHSFKVHIVWELTKCCKRS